MKTPKLQLFLIIIITFLGGYLIGKSQIPSSINNYAAGLTVESKALPTVSPASVDMSQFWQVWTQVAGKYYDQKQVDMKKMINGAITGMVASIGDPYTMYLPPAQQSDFKQQLAGQFGGIGAELGMKDKQIIVISPIDGSPAQKAGIKAGDAILKVAGNPTNGWTLQQGVEKIRGEKGTKVTLTILHKGAPKMQDITITRDTITIKSIEGWIKPIKDIEHVNDSVKQQYADKKVMYLRLSQFGDATNQDWTAVVAKLKEKYTGDVKGIILDLRNNPGGYLTDAAYISADFLPMNTPVVHQDPGNKGVKTTLNVVREGVLLDKPLIVLINKGSASASEIVSGALRDHKRAKLVGETSFGKGTIQEAIDLGKGAGLHVTIAKWLTPNGTWVHGKGLKPDIEVKLDEKDQERDTQLERAISELMK